jgi:MAP/microtubule affinity-regulating kinase
MNMGYEESEELKPYVEPPKDVKDDKLIQVLKNLGYNSQAISDALERERFEEIHATYLMLKASKNEFDSIPGAQGQSAETLAQSGGAANVVINKNRGLFL